MRNDLRSNDFGDSEIGYDVVGVVRRAGQGGVGPDERLAGATVDLDTESGDRDPRVGALERLLAHRNDVHRARLEVDLDLLVERRGERDREQPPAAGNVQARRDAGGGDG